MSYRPDYGQVQPRVSFPPPVRPVQTSADADLTAAEAGLLCALLQAGRNEPDLWSCEERAAVNRLFGIRDGRRRANEGVR